MKTNEQLGYLFIFGLNHPVYFSLQPVMFSTSENKTVFTKITYTRKETDYLQKFMKRNHLSDFKDLTEANMRQILFSNGFFANPFASSGQSQVNLLAEEALNQYCLQRLWNLWPFLTTQENVFYLLPNKKIKDLRIMPVSLGLEAPILFLKANMDKESICLQMYCKINDRELPAVPAGGKNELLIEAGGKFYVLDKMKDIKLLRQFPQGKLVFHRREKMHVLRNFIFPLEKQYRLDLPPGLTIHIKQEAAAPQLKVAEYLNQFLMLMPQFLYDGNLVDYEDGTEILISNDKGNDFYPRSVETETAFFESLRALHPAFQKQRMKPFFYLPFTEVMKGSWFLKTIRKLQDQNVTVTGMKELKKFRYNPSVPVLKMKTTSGMDWFDLRIEVSYGAQKVPLRDIQKAIKSHQKVILLGDGSLGLIPEEWFDQYGMIMSAGEETKGKLRVNKALYTLMTDLHNLQNDKVIQTELKERIHLLQNVDTINLAPVSDHIQADLRPYQIAGFHWLQTLDKLQWGGCLADDMGLGKTLQTICFLQYVKETYSGSVNLVVCPTSLIYNWESELQKFAPDLKYHIYYGSNRSVSEEHLEKYDLIITSYGNMRNDITHLQNHVFHYVVLDESQAIKNPEALVTKAALLLKAKNRLILSGTPVQNNTFDLYAQMHFLNRGFLGNKEFFKNKFAIPIDKFGDSETAAELRKLVYPFILRRTKEKVASDLPDKTESILWCEMSGEQKKVYDEYKNYYRFQLQGKIEETGLEKATIFILEGLMRLRQICDSPLLVKDPEVKTSASIKIEELLREVLENSGNHKILIFSQFTQMLSLIREAFNKHNIKHIYLDGQTPAAERKSRVDQFQNEPDIQAFLISLKAGGVGLNLTAADYVYLIDPWWNPAVEDQSIDRTHRIGQTQKVFAYKMICKDTVEEKILQLQQKKKALSSELISEEKSFVKKLTKEDINFLFS